MDTFYDKNNNVRNIDKNVMLFNVSSQCAVYKYNITHFLKFQTLSTKTSKTTRLKEVVCFFISELQLFVHIFLYLTSIMI